MRILVIGATGVVGRQLVPMLVGEGHEVTATTTTVSKAGGLAAAGAEPLVMDVLDAAATEAALIAARPEVVVYQATALSWIGANMRKFDRYFAVTNRLRTEGTANLLAAVRKIGGARVIAQSFGASGFPPGGPPAQDESAGFNPRPPAAMAGIFAAIRRLEELVTATPDGVVLRYGGFYGPGTSLDRHGPQIEAIRRRLMPIVGDGGGVVSYLHVEDAATATVAALDAGQGDLQHRRRRAGRLPRLAAVRRRRPRGRASAAPTGLVGPDRRRRGGRVPDDPGTRRIERAGQGRTGLEAGVSGLARGIPGRIVGLTGPIRCDLN